jgi:hypothetical protein
METNNDILADKPVGTHIGKSILDEPDPPDKEMDGTEIDAEDSSYLEQTVSASHRSWRSWKVFPNEVHQRAKS